MTAPRRRWSFSLRTLFVVVTVFGLLGGYIANQFGLVQERRVMLDSFTATGGRCGREYAAGHGIESSRVPFVRKLLGDEEIRAFWFPEGTDQQTRDRFTRTFPEAYVPPHDGIQIDRP
jgi:hypothetical protein